MAERQPINLNQARILAGGRVYEDLRYLESDVTDPSLEDFEVIEVGSDDEYFYFRSFHPNKGSIDIAINEKTGNGWPKYPEQIKR